MSNRLNCEAPPQPKARAARESVSSCADCATATQPRAPVPNPIPVLVPVPVPVPVLVPIPVPDHISPRRGTKFSSRTLLPFSCTTRDLSAPVCVQPAFSIAFWLLTRDSLIELVCSTLVIERHWIALTTKVRHTCLTFELSNIDQILFAKIRDRTRIDDSLRIYPKYYRLRMCRINLKIRFLMFL